MKEMKFVVYGKKNGKEYCLRCSGIYDYVEDETTFDTVRVYTDGEYYWTNEETYHFEKYNLKLNDDFIQKVLNN